MSAKSVGCKPKGGIVLPTIWKSNGDNPGNNMLWIYWPCAWFDYTKILVGLAMAQTKHIIGYLACLAEFH
jgi:hypothetical protein